MDKKLYSDYSTLCGKIKLLEETKSVLAKTILEDMGDAKTVKTDYGAFSVVVREKYEYSDIVKKTEEAAKLSIKNVRNEDILAGNAVLEVVKNLSFRPKVDQIQK